MGVRYDESTANLKDLMTVEPITSKQHAALLRSKVEARRFVEEVREDAKERCDDEL